MIVASVIIASFDVDFASVDATGVLGRMIAGVAQDKKFAKKELLEGDERTQVDVKIIVELVAKTE